MNPYDDNRRDEHETPSPYQSRLQEQLAKDEELRKRKPKKSKAPWGYFFTGLMGVMVGALLVWFIVTPAMTDANDIPTTNKTSIKSEQVSTSVNSDVTAAVDKASDAVVGITNIQKVSNFWSQQAGEQEAGAGSGVIYKVDKGKAFIVTNFHVIDGAERLEVTLKDGTKKEAEVLGEDMWTDLAVIAVDAKDISTVAEFGDSDALKQGEPVIAIGNPLGLDFYGSVTQGIVSGINRSMPIDFNNDGVVDWTQEVLQTDAAINPGNSGGALVNIKGDLIGINSMKIATEKVEGLGFAIPINSALPIIEELEQSGKVERPVLGVSLTDLTNIPAYYQKETLKVPEDLTTGVVVSDVVRESSAAKGGVQQYDIIVEMDGKEIQNAADLRKHLYTEKKVGDELEMKVYRQGKLETVKMKLEAERTL
ncbi:serine protease [Lysinibacillus alkalisoli]|uniref:Serine protease n=1 Tax=Lysinibacillus alkalisoli TaxID=1911548 RepID=A0A917G8J0_9BACI|nr:serine protease [Lysinibacillus alkalisoli]